MPHPEFEILQIPPCQVGIARQCVLKQHLRASPIRGFLHSCQFNLAGKSQSHIGWCISHSPGARHDRDIKGKLGHRQGYMVAALALHGHMHAEIVHDTPRMNTRCQHDVIGGNTLIIIEHNTRRNAGEDPHDISSDEANTGFFSLRRDTRNITSGIKTMRAFRHMNGKTIVSPKSRDTFAQFCFLPFVEQNAVITAQLPAKRFSFKGCTIRIGVKQAFLHDEMFLPGLAGQLKVAFRPIMKQPVELSRSFCHPRFCGASKQETQKPWCQPRHRFPVKGQWPVAIKQKSGDLSPQARHTHGNDRGGTDPATVAIACTLLTTRF